MEMNNEREINLQGSGLTKKVVKGSFWVMVGQVLPLLATFVSTPFVIKYLGSEAYGVLILVGVVAGYFSFADFGMVLASTRFGSEAYATSSSEKEARVIRTAAVIGVSTSLFIAIPLFILSKWVVSDLLRVPVNLQSQASVALKLTSVALVMGFIGNIFNSPQLARLRMDLNILINAGFKILMILITPVVLYFGGGIVEASLVAFGAAFFMMLGNIIVSGTLLPRLFGLSVDKELFRPMLRFGWNVVLYGIGLAVCNNLDKLFLSRYVSVRSLAHYSVAFTFSNMATMFSMAMVQTLIPAFSQVLSPSKRPELINLFLKTVRISLIGIIPSIMVLMVIGKPFFTIWAGKEFGLNNIYCLLVCFSA